MSKNSRLLISVIGFFMLLLAAILPFNSTSYADSKNGVDDIFRGDYTPNIGLHIRKTANTSATSLGVAYPGDKWRADCIAARGTSVNGNSYWFRNRDIKTNIKGYSSAEYMRITYAPTYAYVTYSNTCITATYGK